MKICGSIFHQASTIKHGQNILAEYGKQIAGHRERLKFVIIRQSMILLVRAHHDADLGCWCLLSNILALAAITLYHLAYVYSKLGYTAVVNEYKLIWARVVFNS